VTDITKTCEPKSDQLNADDLIGGRTITIKITAVSLLAGDQPVSLNYEGDQGKPYKPCKSMRRVLVNAWGSDGNKYVGRSLTLYRDDKVTFGGVAVGGIRISHMSDIPETMTVALTATRAIRKPFTVKPLAAGDTQSQGKPTQSITPNSLIATFESCNTRAEFDAAEEIRQKLAPKVKKDVAEKLQAASDAAAKRLMDTPQSPPEDNGINEPPAADGSLFDQSGTTKEQMDALSR
jgi:hypothetical protein